MASRTQDLIYDSFRALASAGPAAALAQTAAQLGTLTSVTANNSKSTESSVTSAVTKVFTSGLGLVPLVSGLLGLFGGGESEQPPPLVKYAMPDKIYFQGADVGRNILAGDYDQLGMPRAYSTGPASATSGGSAQTTPATPQISVNVQAMDARSFLDHSTEIAEAVRQAMLNLNSINDVVNEL